MKPLIRIWIQIRNFCTPLIRIRISKYFTPWIRIRICMKWMQIRNPANCILLKSQISLCSLPCLNCVERSWLLMCRASWRQISRGATRAAPFTSWAWARPGPVSSGVSPTFRHCSRRGPSYASPRWTRPAAQGIQATLSRLVGDSSLIGDRSAFLGWQAL